MMHCRIKARNFPGALVVKNPPAKAGDTRDLNWIPASGRSPGGGHGNPLKYSPLENPMDRGAWWAMVHSVTESDTTGETVQHSTSNNWRKREKEIKKY